MHIEFLHVTINYSNRKLKAHLRFLCVNKEIILSTISFIVVNLTVFEVLLGVVNFDTYNYHVQKKFFKNNFQYILRCKLNISEKVYPP